MSLRARLVPGFFGKGCGNLIVLPEIASSLKAPRNDPLGANANYSVLFFISWS